MFTNLVFEGGGVKGVAYAGALAVLEAKGILPHIERVAGTSAGAIVACLLSLNYRASDIATIVGGMDFSAFEDKENLLKKLHYYGLHPGTDFLTWLQQKITTAPVKLDQNATFSDFRKAGCRDLHVFACDLYTQSLAEFSYQTTPDVTVAEAVRASMSIPLFFNAWKFSNGKPNDHLYVDGGTVYNFPITAFDNQGDPNWATLGFRLEDVNGKRVVDNFGYGHWIPYVKALFETLMNAQTIDVHRDPEEIRRSVIIDDLGVRATDFDIDEATKQKLVASGKSATEAYLAGKNILEGGMH